MKVYCAGQDKSWLLAAKVATHSFTSQALSSAVCPSLSELPVFAWLKQLQQTRFKKFK